VLRLVEKRHLRHARDLPLMRRRFKLQARIFFCDPPFATYLPGFLEWQGLNLPVQWVRAGLGPKSGGAARDGVILYLHGGAYVIGAPETHRAMLARLSEMTGLQTVLPNYRLAPEHPFPAAIEDALAAYQALIARGYRAEQIILGGDSAGGGLCLALLHAICHGDLPRPGGVFAFSPWTDLTLSGDSLKTNAAADPFLPADRVAELRDMYLDGHDPSDPRASPQFGAFDGAPPVLIQVGTSEILLDDSKRMEQALQAQGVQAQLTIWPRVPHVWQIFQGRLPQADRALKEVSDFIAARL
jgi:acetyl esterase/lipase